MRTDDSSNQLLQTMVCEWLKNWLNMTCSLLDILILFTLCNIIQIPPTCLNPTRIVLQLGCDRALDFSHSELLPVFIMARKLSSC